MRRRALKREDRLFFVADREDRWPYGSRARARKELSHQPANDLPLLGTRVLRLIDQHMVDALIELVVHPSRAIVAKQSERLVDQVVVVEQTTAILCRLIAEDHGIGDGEECRRTI